MFNRLFYVYGASLKSFFRRLYWDLAKEIVVSICAITIFATFLYIFNDFLNIELQKLSPKMRDFFAQVANVVLLVGATLICIRALRVDSNEDWNSLLRRLGEEAKVRQVFLGLRGLTVTVVVFALAWWIAYKFFYSWPWQVALGLQALVMSIVVGSLFVALPQKTTPKPTHGEFKPIFPRSAIVEMTLWRLKQILFRGRSTRLCLGLSALFVLLTTLLLFAGVPFFAGIFTSFLAGLFVAFALALQVEEDLKFAWAERCWGVDHDTYVRSYMYVGILLGVIPAALLAGMHVVLQPGMMTDSLKLFFAFMTSLFVLPYLLFQVDARRPAIQMMLVTLVSLFLMTAQFAHLLGLVLIPLFIYYAKGTQAGRFYRA